jgi:hypothetical protein
MRATAAAVVLILVAVGLAGSYSATRPRPRTREPLVPTVPLGTVIGRLPTDQPTVPADLPATLTPSQTSSASPAASSTALPVQLKSVTPPVLMAAPTVVRLHPTATITVQPAAAHAAVAWAVPVSDRARVGVGAGSRGIDGFAWGDTPPGWYLNWSHEVRPGGWSQTPFVRMVHPRGDKLSPNPDEIRRTAVANPGTLWLIGNEPDIAWQDNSTPEEYARTYGILYAAIKKADPTARVAIGGISQPTPLRLAYLDRVLAAYKAQYGTDMPVDVWNMHAFILREERNSWGVGIPPGMNVDQGTLREIGDHADMGIFKQQIVDFRRWMAERGERDKPLIVSEYGILMPEDYGFSSDVVSKFMRESFDYLLSARDAELGYPADGNRLVQAFCWFSTADEVYRTSNLFDPETRAISPIGKAFKEYLTRLR